MKNKKKNNSIELPTVCLLWLAIGCVFVILQALERQEIKVAFENGRTQLQYDNLGEKYYK